MIVQRFVSPNDAKIVCSVNGVFDGHGSDEAAKFVKENLIGVIVQNDKFWSENNEDILQAITDEFVYTHEVMSEKLSEWPKRASGNNCTAGTTANVAFIRQSKMFVGHVGDSRIILGRQVVGENSWKSNSLTTINRPDNPDEVERIHGCGVEIGVSDGVLRQ